MASQKEDYQNFVARMGSFEDNFDDLFNGSPKPEQTLEHHGILGMHWGIHRHSQTSVSTAPRKKLGAKDISRAKAYVDTSNTFAKEAKNIHNSVANAKAISKIKDPSNMTDADLKAAVGRMNLEQQYSNLTANQVSKGRNYTNSVLEVAGSALAITSSALGLALTIKQLKG